MLSKEDSVAIQELGRKYSVSRVLLFGSSLTSDSAADVDLAVEGLAPASFFKFYSDLLFALSKPVDLLDLSVKSRFSQMVLREGVAVYG